ncbi:hemolysin family protein [Natronocalculus amylovorans]|uniref:Hemolysin family protein n=1 Tax=Natronocalculus amylovorans TaxID=2917812 RepID=A0AAE3FV16_9EURY|nr:hemolysin family protein [Natronocalculus amylovorans]MCL9815858.1 hemolysin family protein [Natronocalculus amylovorans]NUE01630.1 HlyC/CorC family transporter [Halorubraceae archaeon YAN]
MGLSLLPTLLWLADTAIQLQSLGVNIDDRTLTIMGAASIVVLIALSGFFSSSEIAFFSLPQHRIDSMVEEGVKHADTVKALKDNPHRLLVTILVGNNIVNIAMSSIATTLFAIYLSQGQAVVAATFGITAIVLLFGESAPKSYAVEHTESWALRISKPLKYSEYALYPLVIIFDRLTRVVNKLTGSDTAIESPYVTRDEIQDIIETGEREGVIEEEEREMLNRIFRFNSTIAKEVMTPRLDVTAVEVDSTLEEAIETCVTYDHVRVPVYDGNLDNVVGIVNIRDLVREQYYGEGNGEIMNVVKPTLHVPESKNVDELLTEMQENRLQMVIVIDEFGTTEGLVTLEDMVEEIVGDILEGDEEEAFEVIDEQTSIIRGETNIDEVNEILEIELPEGEEFETLAGFIFNRAGRLVEEGETFEYNGIIIEIEEVDNTRILKARVTVTEEYPLDEQEVEASNGVDES